MRIETGTLDAFQVDNVYLDGKLIDKCYELDVAEGWVSFYKVDASGKLIVKDHDLVRETHCGSVTIDQKKN